MVERLLDRARRSTSTWPSAPSASPRARRMDGARTRCPQIVVAAARRGASSAPPSCSRTLTDDDRRARAGGGRAGQAVHQHVALHQVRRRQPALHDRQRLRRSTSSASAPALVARLPAGRRHARRRVRRRAVPVQGHDAAGGVQQQQLHARPRQHDGQRGPAAVPRRPARAAPRPRRHDRRHPRHGVQGRVRRHPLQPELQAQAHPAASRPARCCAPTRTSPSTPTSCPLDEVLARGRPARHRRAAPGLRATSTTDLPVVDIWNLLGDGVRV